MSKKDSKLTQEEKMLRGTVWATVSDFVSRILGVLYIIPWFHWMGQFGNQASGLFSMGYTVYGTVLLLSTAGINAAIAKQVSRYRALGQEDEIIYMMRAFLGFMSGLGIVAAIVLYLGAPLFAELSGGTKELTAVLRSLTLAVFMFPPMSVIRGLFQGYNDFKPYALSQIAEQLVRVIWMLVTTFAIMKLGSRDYVDAVVQSTFAAVLGMVASIVVLLYFLSKEGLLKKLIQKPDKQSRKSNVSMLIETMRVALPFVIVGAAIQIFQLIDQSTFFNLMARASTYDKEQLIVIYSYMSGNPNRIIMVLISVATSIASVGLALITEGFTKGDRQGVARLITNNLQMLALFIFPAVTGAIVLAQPLYNVFYRQSEPLAIGLFVAMLLQTLVVAFYTVVGPMLQALFENRKAIRYFVYGLLVKIVLQAPATYLFYGYGPILTTTLGLLVSVGFMYIEIQRVSQFSHSRLVRQFLLTAILTVIMGTCVFFGKLLLHKMLKPTGYINSAIYIAALGTLGIMIYGYLTLLTRQLDKIIGAERASAWRQKLRIPV